MTTLKRSPGPAAHRAFRTGMLAAGLAGLVGIALLYWASVLTLASAGSVLLLLFPVYLLVAASLLSVWLGFGKDATHLRPVYREKGETE